MVMLNIFMLNIYDIYFERNTSKISQILISTCVYPICKPHMILILPPCYSKEMNVEIT